MNKNFITLGIETSCDETAIAILKNKNDLLSNKIFTQIDIHKKFGGVVPEVASRNHLEKINIVIKDALDEAKVHFSDLNLIAVSNGPGLIGSLLIGTASAKALAFSLDIPIKIVNHIAAHIFANFIEHKDLKPPFLSLIISGGHTFLAKIDKDFNMQKIGETRDDAIGEAYDKVARVLGLPYPGGPNLERLAKDGDKNSIYFKKSLIDEDNSEFSFSGIKTGVINYLNKEKMANNFENIEDLLNSSPELKKNIAASFQKTVTDVLVTKTISALEKTKEKSLVIGGGVSANSYIKNRLKKSLPSDIKLYYPSPVFSTDNAAMIAITGYLEYMKDHISSGLKFDAFSRS